MSWKSLIMNDVFYFSPEMEKSIRYSSDSDFHPNYKEEDQPDAFVFTKGDLGLLTPRTLSKYCPYWKFTDAKYGYDSDDEFVYEREHEVDDNALDVFVNRVLTKVMVAEEDDTSFGINSISDGIVEDMELNKRPIHRLPGKDKNGWKKKMRKARKDGKKERMPVPEMLGPYGLHLPIGTVHGITVCDPDYVSMPLQSYRETVMAEVDSMARRIYLYFNHELQCFDEIRINALKDALFWHEKANMIQKVLEKREDDVEKLREENTVLKSQIEKEKNVKRQRRTDKKRRKAEKTTLATVESETPKGAGVSGGLGEGDSRTLNKQSR